MTRLPSKQEGLSSEPCTLQKPGLLMHVYDPERWGIRDRQIPVLRWLASPAEAVSFQLNERPSLKYGDKLSQQVRVLVTKPA